MGELLKPSAEEMEKWIKIMEEMANLPREKMGKREPGEKCAYEISQKFLYE